MTIPREPNTPNPSPTALPDTYFRENSLNTKTTTSNDDKYKTGKKKSQDLLPTLPTPTVLPDTYYRTNVSPINYSIVKITNDNKNLYQLANQFGVTPNSIIQANPNVNVLIPGMYIKIPINSNLNTPTTPINSNLNKTTTPITYPNSPSVQNPENIYNSSKDELVTPEFTAYQIAKILTGKSSLENNPYLNSTTLKNITKDVYNALQSAVGKPLTGIYKFNPATGMYELNPSIESKFKSISYNNSEDPGIAYLQYLASKGQKWAQEVLQTQPWTQGTYNKNISVMQWIHTVKSKLPYQSSGGGGGRKSGGKGGSSGFKTRGKYNTKNQSKYIPYQTPQYYTTRYGNLYNTFGLVTWRI